MNLFPIVLYQRFELSKFHIYPLIVKSKIVVTSQYPDS